MRIVTTIFLLLSAILAAAVFPKAVFATHAALSCTPPSGTYNIGDTITVNYILNTRSYTSYGAQVIATYSTDVVDVVGNLSTPVTTDTNWTQPVTNSIDTTLGKIDLDYGNSQTAFTGNSSIGQVSFKAKAVGQLEFGFVFYQQYDDTTPGVAKVWGKKDNTNISNILTDVTNCIYVIGQTATATPTVTSDQPTPTTAEPSSITPPISPMPSISELPRTGKTEQVIGLLGLSIFILTIGSIVPVLSLGKKRGPY